MIVDYSQSLADSNVLSPLDAIYQLESSGGKNKKARVQNSSGALGNYQITPGLFEDIKKHFPEYKDISFEQAALHPEMDRKVANAGLNVIATQLQALGVSPTMQNVALAYHSGIGNVKNNKIGPYGKKYLEDFTSLTGM